MAKRKKRQSFPKLLISICIITGISTLVLRMLNRRLQVSDLAEITGYTGTVFVISLIIIIGIWLVNQVNKK